MIKIQRVGNPELVFVFVSLLAISLYWSFFLISISVISLAVLTVFELQFYPRFSIGLNPRFISAGQEILKHPLLLSIVALFIWGFISYFWSEDTSFWFKSNQMRLPLLVIPLSLVTNNTLSKIQLNYILKFFITVGIISSCYVMFFYIKNHELYSYAIKHSKAIYTPFQHIRFSSLLVMAFACCVFFIQQTKVFQHKIVYFMAACFFFIVLHILAVKGCLLALYTFCFVAYSLHALQKKQYIQILLLVIGLITSIILALLYVPSLNQKLHYVKYEISEYKLGRWQNLSDIERLVSYDVGFQIMKKNPILGTGLGDFTNDTRNAFQEKYNYNNYKLPHNDLIFHGMALGIIGMLLMLWIYITWFGDRFFRKDILCLGFIIPLTILGVFNDTLQSQQSVGMTIFVIIILFTSKYKVPH